MYSNTSPSIGPVATRTFLPLSSDACLLRELKSAAIVVPLGSQPMKLRATAIPMPTATPPPTPAAPDAATAPTIASIVAVLVASMVTEPTSSAAVPIALFCTKALVLVRMMLVASAPPPATATPAAPPSPNETAAATEVARMDDVSFALTVTASAASTRPASLTAAVVSVAIELFASDTPTEIAAPNAPPAPTATATAPASAEILESSLAPTMMDWAPIPEPSPVIVASIRWPIRLVAETPAPLAATPPTPPPANAAEPARTSESILLREMA